MISWLLRQLRLTPSRKAGSFVLLDGDQLHIDNCALCTALGAVPVGEPDAQA